MVAPRAKPVTASPDPAAQIDPTQIAARDLIGQILVKPDIFRLVRSEGLSPYDISDRRLRAVWSAALTVDDRQEEPEAPAIFQELKESGALEQIGGMAFLTELLDKVVFEWDVRNHVRRLQRAALEVSINVAGQHLSNGLPLPEKIELMRKTYERIEKRRVAIRGEVIGINSGPELQAITAQREWIIPGWLMKTGTTILAGPSGAQKSFLAWQIARQCALGWGMVCDRAVMEKPLNTWVILGEDDEIEMRDRYALMGDVELPEHFKWTVSPDLPEAIGLPLGTKEGEAWLRDGIRRNKTDLVVLDNLFTLSAMDLIDNQDVGRVMFMLRRLRRQFGVTFLIVHHPKKGGGISSHDDPDEIFGAGALRAASDVMLRLDKHPDPTGPNDDRRVLRHLKTRSGRTHAPFVCQLEPGMGMQFVEDYEAPPPQRRGQKHDTGVKRSMPSASSVGLFLRSRAPGVVPVEDMAQKFNWSVPQLQKQLFRTDVWAECMAESPIEVTKTTRKKVPIEWRWTGAPPAPPPEDAAPEILPF